MYERILVRTTYRCDLIHRPSSPRIVISYLTHDQFVSKMSQEQGLRPTQPQLQTDPIKYGDVFAVPGDVFAVSGDLAGQPIAPRDAAMMQSAESVVLGQGQKGGVAATMQSAATINEAAGLVGHTQTEDIVRSQGVTVMQTDVSGKVMGLESIAGEVVGQYAQPAPEVMPAGPNPTGMLATDTITIGEALQVSAMTCGDKPVEQSDASAIQVAEVRATGSNVITPGGVAATAQHAADMNARVVRDEDKTTLGDVLTDATQKLPVDKVVTRRDAEGIVGAELRNNPRLATSPSGVAESVVAAAWLNEANEK